MTMEIDNAISDNVIDFTAHKLRSMVEEQAAIGHADLAAALQEALDEYMLGNIDIAWRSGWPHTVKLMENDT